jgi:hypothetical protein
MMPKEPSNIPASTTVSCYNKSTKGIELLITHDVCMTRIEKSIGKFGAGEKNITKCEPINRASALAFLPSTRPCTFPKQSTHLENQDKA